MSTPVDPPPNWGKDTLTTFFELARENAFASSVKTAEYEDLSTLDAQWSTLAETIETSGTVLEGMFLIRAHAACRSAVYNAMSGQIPEGFVLLRSALECALYAHHIFVSDAAAEIWLRRTDGDTRKDKSRKEFSYRNVRGSLVDADKELAEIAIRLYNDTIEFGGHPNEQALLAVSDWLERGEDVVFTQHYLSGGSLEIKFGLVNAMRVGLCCLYIFRRIYKTRVDILGLTDELDRLKRKY